MHLSEYLLPGERPRRIYQCFTMEEGVRREREFVDVCLTDSDFEVIGAWIDREPFVRHSRIGAAYAGLSGSGYGGLHGGVAAIPAAQGGGMTELAEILPPPPLFFLSYAKSGQGTSADPANELDLQVVKFSEIFPCMSVA